MLGNMCKGQEQGYVVARKVNVQVPNHTTPIDAQLTASRARPLERNQFSHIDESQYDSGLYLAVKSRFIPSLEQQWRSSLALRWQRHIEYIQQAHIWTVYRSQS